MRLYVSTYAQYNNGNLYGAWIDFDTEDELYEKARALHAKESDPEFMFQDFEDFPKAFYGESHLDERLWEWAQLDDHEKGVVEAYLDNDSSTSIQYALDSFIGSYNSAKAFAEECIENDGVFQDHPSYEAYFDYERYIEGELKHDFVFIDYDGEVYVFCPH